MIVLALLTACLPAPVTEGGPLGGSDSGVAGDMGTTDSGSSGDDGGGGGGGDTGDEGEHISVTGTLSLFEHTEMPSEAVTVGLIALSLTEEGFELGETYRTQTLTEFGDGDGSFGFGVDEVPSAAWIEEMDVGLDGMLLMPVAWIERDDNNTPSAADTLVGGGDDLLVYLEGTLPSDIVAQGAQEGWNKVDLYELLGLAGPGTIYPWQSSYSLDFDTNLLPQVHQVLDGEILVGSDAATHVNLYSLTGACPSETVPADPIAGIGATYGRDTFTLDIDLGEPDDDHFSDGPLTDCGHEVAELYDVEIATYLVFAFEDRNSSTTLDGDEDVIATNFEAEDATLVAYMRPTGPLAVLYAYLGGGMGWQIMEANDSATEPFRPWASGVELGPAKDGG